MTATGKSGLPKSAPNSVRFAAKLGVVAGLFVACLTALAYWQVARIDPQPWMRAEEPGASSPEAVGFGHETLDASLLFGDLGYDLADIRLGKTDVPRLYLADLPRELTEENNVKARKSLFFKTVLPLVLQVNEFVLADRRRLLDLREKSEAGAALNAREHAWLQALSDEYGLDTFDFERLTRRVDAVPPSLALAQAAIESGWGRSRFAQAGNALFGQWTWKGEGIVPLERDAGATHKIKSFGHLMEAVYGYVINLNTHRAYRDFRRQRLALSLNRERPSGSQLAESLIRYSERGDSYVRDIQSIIRQNRLDAFDQAWLEHSGPHRLLFSRL